LRKIDHDPNENRWKIPVEGQMEKEALRKKLGREPRPSDILTVYGTAIALGLGFAIYHYFN